MGCKCANSNNDEYEVISRERCKENTVVNNNDNNLIDIMNNNNEKMNNQDNNINLLNNNCSDYEGSKNQNEYEKNENINSKYLNFPEKFVEIINNIRQDPVSYSYIVEDSIKNIIENNNKGDNKIIYKKKLKWH